MTRDDHPSEIPGQMTIADVLPMTGNRAQRRAERARGVARGKVQVPVLPASAIKMTVHDGAILIGVDEPGYARLEFDEAQVLYEALERAIGKLAEQTGTGN